ncbi:MAG: replication initiator protein A [Actinomycetota bacterium]|nr:replication initiator protein A [Actinomycetota bacterium]
MNSWKGRSEWAREALGEATTNRGGHPSTVQAERNVEEWPVFGLGRAKGSSQSRERTSTIVGEDGSELKQRLEVSAPGKYRLPGRFDYDVYSAVLELLEIRGGMPEDGTLRFSLHELILIMGVEPSGRTYEEVRRSLRRIAATVLESDNAFWSKGQQRHISDTFHMWSVRFDSVTDKNGSGSRHEIEFGKLFRRSFAEQYLRGLDIEFFWGLDSPVAKRLYRLVDLKRDGAASWGTDLFDLQNLIPIGPYAYVSKIKEKLSAAHEELVQRGFLSDVGYEGKSGVEYAVSAAFVDRRKGLELSGTREDYIAIKLLTESSLRGDVARDLVAKHGPAHCTLYANALPHQKNLRNPAGWLRKAIEEGYEVESAPKPPFLPDAQKRNVSEKAGSDPAQSAGAKRRREGYDWLFGE